MMSSGMRGFRVQSVGGISMDDARKLSAGNVTGYGQSLKQEWEEVARVLGMGSNVSGHQSAGVKSSLGAGGSSQNSNTMAAKNNDKSTSSSCCPLDKKCNFVAEIVDRYDICDA
jgi:hypothetical protein